MLVLIGRAEQMGLGVMTEELALALEPSKVIILDCCNGREVNPTGIKNAEVVKVSRWRAPGAVAYHLKGVTVALGIESFYRDDFTSVARNYGIKSVLFPMWDWTSPQNFQSDILINVSDTDQEYSKAMAMTDATKCIRYDWPASPFVHEPDRKLNWPPKTFVHIAGNAGRNRNGTLETLSAAAYLEGTDAKLVVYHAFPIDDAHGFTVPPKAPIEFRGSLPSRRDLFKDCDCLVFPRGLPGHSLPINEAVGEGIPCVVLNLPDWMHYPYKVAANPAGKFTFVRNRSNPPDLYGADPIALGMLLRDMAMGKETQRPGPKLPSWSDFVKEWKEWIK